MEQIINKTITLATRSAQTIKNWFVNFKISDHKIPCGESSTLDKLTNHFNKSLFLIQKASQPIHQTTNEINETQFQQNPILNIASC
jgi:hypothetical protein